MIRPRLRYADSEKMLLEHMKPGVNYLRDELAAAVGMEPWQVGNVLTWMKERNVVSKAPFRGQTCHWRIVEKCEPVVDDYPCSVAGPPYPPDLRATMLGYDAAFRTRVELAMMGRGR